MEGDAVIRRVFSKMMFLVSIQPSQAGYFIEINSRMVLPPCSSDTVLTIPTPSAYQVDVLDVISVGGPAKPPTWVLISMVI